MNKQKGFTIIELIIVIAIIAVLAAIVLVNVTQYIQKGKDAAIKADMSTLQTNGAVYFDKQSPTTYAGFKSDATLYGNPETAAIGQGAALTNESESASAYCITMKLNDTTYWCVDSTGYSGAPTAAATCADTNIACK